MLKTFLLIYILFQSIIIISMNPPETLLNLMGVWASVAGTLGLLANTLVIILFSCTKKVTPVSFIK